MAIKVQRFFMTVLFSAFAINFAAASVPEEKGFLVFTTKDVQNYVADSKGALSLSGIASGDSDDYLTANGDIYYLEKLIGKVSKLGPNLKPVLQEALDHSDDVPSWLGASDKNLLILNNNQIVFLDYALKEVARLPLTPWQHQKITPVLNPKTFLHWKGKGYLLANTHEVYIFPLDQRKAIEPLKASILAEEGFDVDNMWIDPDENTLNLLGHTQKYDDGSGLEVGHKRVTSSDVVARYSLDCLNDAPKKNIIYEKVEIHYPAAVGRPDFPDDGRIYERMPPYKAEGKARGTRIGLITRSTPAYARAFIEGAEAFPSRSVIRLKSLGRYDVQEVRRDEVGTKITVGGKPYYVEEDLRQHVLRLVPESYARLKVLPEMKNEYFDVISY